MPPSHTRVGGVSYRTRGAGRSLAGDTGASEASAMVRWSIGKSASGSPPGDIGWCRMSGSARLGSVARADSVLPTERSSLSGGFAAPVGSVEWSLIPIGGKLAAEPRKTKLAEDRLGGEQRGTRRVGRGDMPPEVRAEAVPYGKLGDGEGMLHRSLSGGGVPALEARVGGASGDSSSAEWPGRSGTSPCRSSACASPEAARSHAREIRSHRAQS
mmetsp:Transcript_25825/g.81657  ORF Transcript_25825/g.81657 Transcript_25825/m.81657 type:complete len:214 (+) Transcript_25825:1110-1751(+)